MEEPLLHTLDDYLFDRLDPAARTAFEARLEREPALRDALATHRALTERIEAAAVRQLLTEMHHRRPAPRRATDRKAWVWAGAVAAALLVGVLGWRQLTTAEPYARYFEPYPGLPTTLGATEAQRFAEGMVAYKLGEYAEAVEWWEPLPPSDTVQLFKGVAYLAAQQPAPAVLALQPVAENPASSFQEAARWYLALAYLQQKDGRLARPLLEFLAAVPGPYQARSQELLTDL